HSLSENMLFNFSPQWRVSVIRTWTIALLMIQFSFWEMMRPLSTAPVSSGASPSLPSRGGNKKFPLWSQPSLSSSTGSPQIKSPRPPASDMPNGHGMLHLRQHSRCHWHRNRREEIMASPKESIGQHKTRMPKPIVLVSALLALFALIAAGRYASTFIKNQRLCSNHKTKDTGPDGHMAWIGNYCAKNPLKSLSTA